MAYPTDLDDFTQQQTGETILANDVNELQTAIESIEAKVGVDSSAVTTSLDYKLKNSSSVDPGHLHTSSGISGQISVAKGGTGAATLTGLVKGNGTSAMTAVTAPSGAVVGDTDTQTLTNKTLTTPTIGSFANANHNHQDSAGGGQLNATSVFSAGTVPTARLGSGTANSSSFLRGDQTWAAISLTYTSGTAGKDASDASTSQTIAHGLGKTPTRVRIRAIGIDNNNSYFAETSYNGTTQSSISSYNNAATGTTATTFTLNLASANVTQTGVVTFDGTNITITWTKTGSATGSYILLWEAEG